MILLLIILAVIFDFLNGFHDSANVVATVITSEALPPRRALVLAAVSEFIGPFLFGVAVATTIGDGILHAYAITINVTIAAICAAIFWNLLTWFFALPSSSSHALIGGLVGAGLAFGGWSVIIPMGLLRVVLALLLSPPLGLLAGFLFMRLFLFLLRRASPTVNSTFKRLQLLTLVGLSLSHGSNDAQKTMGVISLGLVTAGVLETFSVPPWVIAISATSMALGTAVGSWRLIRTLGAKIFRIRPIHAFTSQLAGASVILGASLSGGPVSTTQVLSSSIAGTGAAERISKVRWTTLRDMVYAWLLTIPVTTLLGAAFFLILDRVTS